METFDLLFIFIFHHKKIKLQTLMSLLFTIHHSYLFIMVLLSWNPLFFFVFCFSKSHLYIYKILLKLSIILFIFIKLIFWLLFLWKSEQSKALLIHAGSIWYLKMSTWINNNSAFSCLHKWFFIYFYSDYFVLGWFSFWDIGHKLKYIQSNCEINEHFLYFIF